MQNASHARQLHAPHTRSAPFPTAAASGPVEALLLNLVRLHEELVHASGAHREAIRQADTTAIGKAREQVEAVCAQIANLDQERQAIVKAMAPENPDATLTFLATRLAEPERSRSLELAKTLRELIIKARTDQRRLRAATDSMLRHVRGVVQQVQQSLNHAGTYGRGGCVDAGVAVVSGIDMTT